VWTGLFGLLLSLKFLPISKIMHKSFLRNLVILIILFSANNLVLAKKAGSKASSDLNSTTLSGGIVHSEGYFLPRGMKIPVELRTPIDTRSSQEKDLITVQVTEDILLGDYLIIPANSFLHGYISKLEGPGRMHRAPKVELSFDTVSLPAKTGSQDRQMLSIKGSVKEVQVLKNSDKVTDSDALFKSKAKKVGALGAIGGATTAFYITQSAAPFATFGIAGMLNNIAILGSGVGGFMLATSFLEKDDIRMEPGTKLVVMLEEPTYDSFPGEYPLAELKVMEPSPKAEEAYDKNLNEMQSMTLK
jgi:hypothetical protein